MGVQMGILQNSKSNTANNAKQKTDLSSPKQGLSFDKRNSEVDRAVVELLWTWLDGNHQIKFSQ